jgi:hypothetical protein
MHMNEPVLVLNANFEPLNVCDTRRAIGLLPTGKAEMLANGRGVIHTPRVNLPKPSSSGSSTWCAARARG